MTDPACVLVDARIGWGSGIGRYVENLVPLVAARMPDLRFDVAVQARDLATARAGLSGVPNLRVIETDIPGFSLAEQWRLPRLGSDYALTWFTNYWVPLRWSGRFVATVHDLMHLEPSIFPASLPKRRLARLTFGKVARDAAGVLFVSRFSQRTFDRRFGAPVRSAVTHLGIDHRGFDAPPDAIPEKRPRLLVVAAAKAHKNFAIVLDAWAQAHVAPHWTLTIVTPDDAGLRSMIDLRVAGGRNRVERRRDVTNAELQMLYCDSAALLMPSLYEGFGLPLLEGMAAGTSCIAAPADALVEIASGGIVDFVNGRDLPGWIAAIERLCAAADAASPALTTERERNMAHAARFRWATTAEHTVPVLRAALA